MRFVTCGEFFEDLLSCMIVWVCIPFGVQKWNSVPRQDLATPLQNVSQRKESHPCELNPKTDLSTEVSWNWSFWELVRLWISSDTTTYHSCHHISPGSSPCGVMFKTSAWRLPWSLVDQFQPLDLYCNNVKVLPSPSFCQQPPKTPVIGSQHRMTQRKTMLSWAVVYSHGMSCKLDDCMHRYIHGISYLQGGLWHFITIK